jgi:integrase
MAARVPVPGVRVRDERWSIFWRAGKKIHEISADVFGPDAANLAAIRRCEVELALRTGSWPEWARRKPAVRRLVLSAMGSADDSALLAAYAEHVRAESSPRWAEQSIRTIRRSGLRLAALDPAEAQRYLDRVAGSASIATRNRARAIFSRFFRWAARHGGPSVNPFGETRSVRERDQGQEIVYLSREEREAVLAAADGLPDGLAVWLALYAGLRRQEVWRVEARHIDLRAGRLLVPRAKTGVRRSVPIAKGLAERLRAGRLPAGRAVPWPNEYWPMCSAEVACIAELRRRCAEKIPRERIGWTVFRHTFGSLLAQAGVSLDKISAWMGNTPAVCRAHYAQFVPRDQRDEEIDRL